jgi:DNA-binding Lrp family transcriptional regulator
MTERQQEIFDLLTELRKEYTVSDSWMAAKIGISKQVFWNQINKTREMDEDIYKKAKEAIINFGKTGTGVVATHFNFRKNQAKEPSVSYDKILGELKRSNDLLDGLTLTQKILADRVGKLEKELADKDKQIEDLSEAVQVLGAKLGITGTLVQILEAVKSGRLS